MELFLLSCGLFWILDQILSHLCLFFSQLVLEDSDVDILSDITVSSVHTSDLSSFEEDSEDMLSDSTEEGEIVSDGKVILTFG